MEDTSTPTLPVKTADLPSLMLQCQPDRDALNQEIADIIKPLMFLACRTAETALPDFREPGSADCRLYNALRSQILNAFNGKIREIPLITKNYLLQQVFVRQVVEQVVVAGSGVFNLPPNVQVRGA